MKINVKKHGVVLDQEGIEFLDERGLVVTVIPRKNDLVVVSKCIKDVETDMEFPQKVTVNM